MSLETLFLKVFIAIAPPGREVIWLMDRALSSDPQSVCASLG